MSRPRLVPSDFASFPGTPAARWRAQRDVCAALLHDLGVSDSVIETALGISRTHVRAIARRLGSAPPSGTGSPGDLLSKIVERLKETGHPAPACGAPDAPKPATPRQ